MIAVFILSLGLILSGASRCPAASGTNLLVNGGFEKILAGRADGWYRDSWNSGALMAVTPQKAHSGRYAAVLQAKRANDIRLIQAVTVEPDTVYRFSGWVATRGVTRDEGSGGAAGANLSVLGCTVFQTGLSGDHDWKLLKFTFRTRPDQTEICLGVRMGFYGQTSAGTAYFDDLRLEKVSRPGAIYQQLDQPGVQIAALSRLEAPQVGSPDFSEKAAAAFPLRWLFPAWFGLFYLAALIGISAWPLLHKIGSRHFSSNVTPQPAQGAGGSLPDIILLGLTLSAAIFKILFGGLNSETFFPASFFKADWGAAAVTSLVGAPLILLLCDSLTAWFLFFSLRRKSPIRALGVAAFFLFLPALFYSRGGGFMDSLFSLLFAFFFWMRTRKPFPGQRVGFGFGAIILLLADIRGLMLLPLLWQTAAPTVRGGKKRKIAPMGIALLAAAVFLTVGRVFILPPAAVNGAANLGISFDWSNLRLGSLFHGDLSYHHGKVSFLLLLGGGLYLAGRRKGRGLAVLGGAWIGFAMFLCWPGMGAGGLLPALTLLLLAFGLYRDAKLFYGAVIMSLSLFFNILTAFTHPPAADRIDYILAVVNGTLFGMLLLFWVTRAAGCGGGWRKVFSGYSQMLQNGLAGKMRLEPFKLRGRDFWILGILMSLYAFLLFYALGSRATPQTGYDFNPPAAGIEISLAKPSTIRQLAYYDAAGTGRFQVEYDRNGAWKKGGEFSCDNYYVLRKEPLVLDGVKRLRFIPQPAAGRLNEIALLDAENRLIPVRSVKYFAGTDGDSGAEPAYQSPLFDEQVRLLPKPSYFNSTYFDEIYHGRTAYEFVTGSPVYENTHPPFGKDVLALGIRIFGMNPWGMRFMHALAGLLLIMTLFFLGRMVLATRFGAYGLMAMGMLDFMPLVQSRYATIDSTSVLLITLMFLFTFKLARQQSNAAKFSAILGTTALIIFCFALAAATKWTALYGAAGVLFIFIVSGLRRSGASQKGPVPPSAAPPPGEAGSAFWTSYSWRKLLICACLLFVLTAPLLYFLTYVPYLKAMGISNPFSWTGCRAVLENQAGMYRYHSQLTATHPFSSAWWSWPFNFKPLWLYMDVAAPAGLKGSIVSLGNPIIWYLGLLGLAVLLFYLFSGRRFLCLTYVMACFCAQYLPWVLVSRVAFIYHFYPVLPWFFSGAVLILEPFWRMERGRYRGLIFLAGLAAVGLLILFYPVLVGRDVSQSFIDNYLRWFPRDWVF